MELTATSFRKQLFQTLDQALQGEAVSITYRGQRLHLTPAATSSKLSRAVQRPIILVDPNALVESDHELMQELEARWSEDDKAL